MGEVQGSPPFHVFSILHPSFAQPCLTICLAAPLSITVSLLKVPHLDCVSCSTQWSRLTEDHRIANNPEEQARLAQASGEALKSHRLYGLNISRMLGDRFLKEQNLGFSASPHVSQPIVVGPEEEVMLVLASDGLWDVLTPARAAMMVARAEGGAAGVADVLVNHAVAQKSKDDISVMVLHITPYGNSS